MFYYQETEQAALKAYFQDPETEDEAEESQEIAREGGEIEMSQLSHDDQMYEGGKRQKKKSYKKDDNSGGIMSNILSCFGNKSKSEMGLDNTQEKWENMTPEQKKERIQQLWSKARRYNNKLRFQARLQKMAESNLKEMKIDDINEDADEENQIIDSQPKLKWYLIDTERTFCKVWNFLITMVTIYTLFVSPYIMTFKSVYLIETKEDGTEEYNQTL